MLKLTLGIRLSDRINNKFVRPVAGVAPILDEPCESRLQAGIAILVNWKWLVTINSAKFQIPGKGPVGRRSRKSKYPRERSIYTAHPEPTGK